MPFHACRLRLYGYEPTVVISPITVTQAPLTCLLPLPPLSLSFSVPSIPLLSFLPPVSAAAFLFLFFSSNFPSFPAVLFCCYLASLRLLYPHVISSCVYPSWAWRVSLLFSSWTIHPFSLFTKLCNTSN